jgi:muramoyltetrapeptide carboxypeptidase
MGSSAVKPIWPLPDQALAVAAPAGAIAQEKLDAGLAVLAELAPKAPIRVDDAVSLRAGYLAGADADRAAHLSELMTAPDLGAVLCARGGFGASRLLPLLDLNAFVANRRMIMGFSDCTALLNALAASGLIALHGPMVSQLPRLDHKSLDALAKLLRGKPEWPLSMEGRSITSGKSGGVLWGGNLTMFCHLLGTPWLPPLDGGILFLEEINEPPYRLDRLLTQLELAGVLDRIAGLALGALSNSDDDPLEFSEVVTERLGGLGLPIVTGFPIGHGSSNMPLPIGALAELDADAGLLTVGLNLA